LRVLLTRLWAIVLATGCAGAGAVRSESDPVREELRTLRRQNEDLAARLDALANRVDLLTARVTKGGDAARTTAAPAAPSVVPAPAADSTMGAVPADLTIVKVTPGDPPSSRGRPAARPRVPPPVPVLVPIREPDAAQLEAIGRPGRRPIVAEADAELREARERAGLTRAHALEDFTTHYPQHPSADNALVEAAAAYDAAGNETAACALARRALDEYPAGDARSEALETLAACEARRGDAAVAEKLLDRLRADFPGTPAARRAEARLSSNPGRDGSPSRELPARSGP
jgi:hypothetical protein